MHMDRWKFCRLPVIGTSVMLLLAGCQSTGNSRASVSRPVPAPEVETRHPRPSAAGSTTVPHAATAYSETKSKLGPQSAPQDDLLQSQPEIRLTAHLQSETPSPDATEAAIPAQPVVPAAGTLSLEQLTTLAMENNPVIRQAEAATHKSVGFRDQVRLYPNPTIGYTGSQLADRGTDQHTAFVTQDVVMGKKLERNAIVLDHDIQALSWDAEAQRRSVLSDVKQLYYKTLGAQHRLAITEEFVAIGKQGMEITNKRKLAGEASKVEVLQAEIQMQQLMIVQRQSIATVQGAWKQLAATIGIPDMAPQTLAGEMPTFPVQHDWEAEYWQLLETSPEVHAALARVCRARANMDRQQVQAIPNLSLMFSAGYDKATNSQLINTQIGMPLPIYNRNQGNQSAAYAEYCRATQDCKRIELSLKSRLAETAREYDAAAATVNLHRDEIVPKAQQMLTMAEESYRGGQIDFLQVLTIRRTYFDAKLNYVAGQTDLGQAQALLEEMLLSGSLNNSPDSTSDDGLRDQSLSGD